MARPTGWGWARWGIVAFVGAWCLTATWPNAPGLLIAVVVTTALALGDRWPLVALVVGFFGLITAAELVPAAESAFLLAMIVASFHVGRYAALTRQPWAAAAVLALVYGAALEDDAVVVADAVFPLFMLGGPWLLGLTVKLAQTRTDRAVDYARSLDDLRAAELRRSLAEERLRIAQDLHDVVAHSITAVSLQAQLARRSVADGVPISEDTLREIERSAQAAMADVRRALGVLRSPGEEREDREPGLADLPDLVHAGQAVGQRVLVDERGVRRSLPPALDAAAHRILQEALTNARRHGVAGPTTVLLDWQQGRLAIEVRNPCEDRSVSVGHGIEGMTERARMLGGSVRTHAEGEEWLVEVHLPLPAESATAAPAEGAMS